MSQFLFRLFLRPHSVLNPPISLQGVVFRQSIVSMARISGAVFRGSARTIRNSWNLRLCGESLNSWMLQVMEMLKQEPEAGKEARKRPQRPQKQPPLR